ncbi:hypothetical protein LC607_04340 [Nostoc sp. CHAB 5824]|nr:hypothetical protein [Nostoc sp. CHAB 5824]
MRKTTIFTLTLLSLAILPVMAQDQTLVGQVWSDFQSYSKDLQDYFQQYKNLSENLNPLESESQNALNSASNEGDLKIPNPIAAGQNLRDNVINYSYNSQSRASRFENNAAVRGNLVSNELNRLITRGVAVGVLGKNAQSRIKAKLEGIQQEVENSGGDESTNIDCPPLPSSPGAGLDIQRATCQLLQQLVNPNSPANQIQQSQRRIIAETFAQSIQTNQSLQYSNLNLANISQQAEEANRARRVDTSTEAARLLRATSQLDLFGREVDK